MKILSNKDYNMLINLIKEQSNIIKDATKVMEETTKNIISLKKENAILKHAIAAQNIDFPNSSVRSSDLYDPIDKLF